MNSSPLEQALSPIMNNEKAVQQRVKNAFIQEMQLAKKLYNNDDLDRAFYHLERAHILGQSNTIAHTKTHWQMLKIGWRKKVLKEIIGQCTRICASIIFSRIWVPIGNTGGANVNPLKPMPIPKDLQKLLLATDKQ